MPDKATKTPSLDDQQWLSNLLNEANSGDAAAIQRSGEFLASNTQLWSKTGDVVGIADQNWIKLISRGNPLAAESFTRQFEATRTELLAKSDCPLEKMLVDVIVATHVELHYLRMVAANTTERTTGTSNQLLNRMESAQRRLTSVMRDLQQLRKVRAESRFAPALASNFTVRHKTSSGTGHDRGSRKDYVHSPSMSGETATQVL